MSFCTTCSKYVYQNIDHYCAHCGSPIERINIGEFTEKQIEAFNDPLVVAELRNTEAGKMDVKGSCQRRINQAPE